MGNTDTITVQATATSLRIVEELYESVTVAESPS